MLTSDNRIEQTDFVHIWDFNSTCPEGKKEFWASVWFTDFSHAHLSQIYANNRAEAFKIAYDRFADCGNYIKEISLFDKD